MKKFLRSMSHILPDKMYLQIMYYKHFHKFINFKNPKTYNEKLQYLKIHDRNPEYIKMVDKIEVKNYIEDLIGKEYVIHTLAVWNNFDEIDIDILPDKFVLKCNHDSKSTVVCKDKCNFDTEKARGVIDSHLKVNGFWYGREWPYKNIKPKVFAEEYIEDYTGGLTDYKILCFNGKAKLCEVHYDRFGEHPTQDFYCCSDGIWEKSSISQGPTSKSFIERPKFLDEMIYLSEKIAKDMKHVRVDWYYTNHLLFGEITFFDGSGFLPFDNPMHDIEIGEWMVI